MYQCTYVRSISIFIYHYYYYWGGGGQILCSNLTLHVYIIHVCVRHTCEEIVQIFLRCEKLVPIFHICKKKIGTKSSHVMNRYKILPFKKLVPNPFTYEESVLNSQTFEKSRQNHHICEEFLSNHTYEKSRPNYHTCEKSVPNNHRYEELD